MLSRALPLPLLPPPSGAPWTRDAGYRPRGGLASGGASSFGDDLAAPDRSDGTARAGSGGALVLEGELVRDESGLNPSSGYFAQHVAQELLPAGVYLDPHPAGIAAYRGALASLALLEAPASALDLRA